MSIQEQRRKAFEAWCDGKGYGSFTTRELLWPCWEAALDSVVIKLPFKHWIDSNSSHAWGAYEAEEVVAALEAAGLKVKP